MKKLIVNADDFGRHEAVNRAVVRGFEQGCITSASIMPNCRAFEDAVEKAAACQGLGIGVHLTLVGEKPLLPVEQVASLVGQNGCFYRDYTVFIQRLLLGKIRLSEVRHELTAQMEKVRRSGLRITHVDSHQHMHVLPGITGIVLALAERFEISALRIPRIPVGFTGGYGWNLSQVVGRAGLAALAAGTGIQAAWKKMRQPDHFSGIVAGECVNEDCLAKIIERLKDGVTEVMLHPGDDDERLKAECGWAHGFEAELEAVLSKRIHCLLKKNGVETVNFDAL